VRNALILLAVVALLILAVGALNNGTAFDVDYVAGTLSAVSLFWVSAVIAALVFVVGLAAAWFAQAAVAGTRRKLEAELQSTYERLREAEALAARPAPATAEAAPAAAAETAVAEPVAVPASEAATAVAGEPETVVVPSADIADGPGETTAVTMTGMPLEAAEAAPADAAGGEDAAAGRPEDDGPGSSGS
jgi:uncharacterized membrane protein YciS (DUF1049 family)